MKCWDQKIDPLRPRHFSILFSDPPLLDHHQQQLTIKIRIIMKENSIAHSRIFVFCSIFSIHAFRFQIKLQVQTDLWWLQIVIGMIESVIAREGACNKSKERAQQQNRGCKRFGKIFRWNLFFRETDYQSQGFGDFCHFFLNTLNKNQNPPSDFRLHPFFLLVIVMRRKLYHH